ncbi:MAG TPA: DUF4865 family protein [Afipia sp.]
MIIVHYAHRLPAGHDMAAIRTRALERGAVWDTAPDLHFKAFVLREAGRFGATANSFSSLYLWQHDKAFRDWLVRGGYEIVTDSFGRADIETFFALDAFRRKAGEARFLYRDDITIPLDADLTAAFAGEIEQARQRVAQPGIVAAVAGLDPRNWKFVRVLLSEDQLNANEAGVAYQIGHLSQPLPVLQ